MSETQAPYRIKTYQPTAEQDGFAFYDGFWLRLNHVPGGYTVTYWRLARPNLKFVTVMCDRPEEAFRLAKMTIGGCL